jgi:hypothetical protein
MTTPLPRNEMKDEDVVRQICEWCLEDEKWIATFIPTIYAVRCFDGIEVDPPAISEPTIEILVCLKDCNQLTIFDIPLTQFLLSPDTVRVCIAKAEGGYAERCELTNRITWHLGRIASCEIDMCSRLDYYRTHFLSSGQK